MGYGTIYRRCRPHALEMFFATLFQILMSTLKITKLPSSIGGVFSIGIILKIPALDRRVRRGKNNIEPGRSQKFPGGFGGATHGGEYAAKVIRRFCRALSSYRAVD